MHSMAILRFKIIIMLKKGILESSSDIRLIIIYIIIITYIGLLPFQVELKME